MLRFGALIFFAVFLAAAAPIPEKGPAASQPPVPSAAELRGGEKSNSTSNQNGPESDQRGTEQAPLIVKVLPTENTNDPADKGSGPQDHQPSEEGGLVIPTWILAAATVGLFIYTAKLWSSTKTLVGDEQRNAALELRAYLSVEPLGINQLIKRTDAIGQVAVRNVGKLPARNVRVIVHMSLKADRNFVPAIKQEPEDSDRTIQPGAELRQGSQDYISIKDMTNPEPVVYVFVWGVVKYEDGFSVGRTTNFCHRYTSSSREPSDWNVTAFASRPVITAEKARFHTSGNRAD